MFARVILSISKPGFSIFPGAQIQMWPFFSDDYEHFIRLGQEGAVPATPLTNVGTVGREEWRGQTHC